MVSYAEVNNWPGELGLDNLTAVVIHSDMERTGWFESSDVLLQPAPPECGFRHAR